MKTYLDCIPCFIRQTVEALRFVTDDPYLQEKIVKKVLVETSQLDLRQSPPHMARRIHEHIRNLTGVKDPYKKIKERFNQAALEMYPELKKMVQSSPDPIEKAVKVSIAGNIIDFGVKADINEKMVEETLECCLQQELPTDTLQKFKESISNADRILFLGDNAGETVFDRILIEEMPMERIVYAVKGGPIINDATLEDAEAAGLTGIVRVIDNGCDAPGTILNLCSSEFLGEFAKADLVIAKGQANYETLSEVKDKEIFFLLKVKCPVIAADIGCNTGEMVVKRIRK
ncbi:MAG: DUF89 family protein [Syntrophomonadaceae bacterium]|nr:DUF89 family protein [Syntrophomonadaceae bacterium]